MIKNEHSTEIVALSDLHTKRTWQQKKHSCPKELTLVTT